MHYTNIFTTQAYPILSHNPTLLNLYSHSKKHKEKKWEGKVVRQLISPFYRDKLFGDKLKLFTKSCLVIFKNKNLFNFYFPSAQYIYTKSYEFYQISAQKKSFAIVIKSGSSNLIVHLPETLSLNLLDFLEKGRPDPTYFCCIDFITYLFGEYKEPNVFNTNSWIFEKLLDQNKLKAGDVISISYIKKNEKQILHLAIYLGSGLYLSIWGTTRELRVATLLTMQKIYHGNTLYMLKHKS